MDKFAERLRRDADAIDAPVADELERRIEASLHAAASERSQRPVPASGRPAWFWWASSLTGAAAALAIVAMLNRPAPETPTTVAVPTFANVPTVDLRAESAMLTEPLRKELEDLQADLKKAEAKVKRDVGL